MLLSPGVSRAHFHSLQSTSDSPLQFVMYLGNFCLFTNFSPALTSLSLSFTSDHPLSSLVLRHFPLISFLMSGNYLSPPPLGIFLLLLLPLLLLVSRRFQKLVSNCLNSVYVCVCVFVCLHYFTTKTFLDTAKLTPRGDERVFLFTHFY